MGDYDDWIGRQFVRTDRITPRMLNEFRIALAGGLAVAPGPGAVPPGYHWCLTPEAVAAPDLGRDGHPRPGQFLPALPLPRRMWAGGEIEWLGAFAVDDEVTKTSIIRSVSFKDGRSGPLGFVAVDHEYSVSGNLVLRERQDLVYRQDPDPSAPAPLPPQAESWQVLAHWEITPDPVLLFRYSALTFNGHRIHYDAAYAREVEGYDGLVVHGPLQAVWLQNLATAQLGAIPRRFSYRGLSPLIVGHSVHVEAREKDGMLYLRVRRLTDDVVTMSARAEAG
ncbi:MaoC family dehydratase N-terminal domain-containing protein [Pseudooceanicola sp.]|uniref:FAS1-like dehydratase domain-containing protein n=1 Tax=Pseudooceanicola sp. TaxID=1914328 RepID=UPI0026135A70|nr:MaoC family dehydratase N-terminal domain-containing protein [Pseudooceanicola sp.]MDF1854827.1 MaoC family dehydratase N-terminal domain-containing protein [Pseudooceanicola sp.]